MLARLLARLPSIRDERERARLERELAVAVATVAILREQLADERALRAGIEAQRDAIQAKFDRLVEARLLRDGAIATTLTEPSKPPTSAPSFFGNIGRLVPPLKHPAPADVDTDSEPAGASMSS